MADSGRLSDELRSEQDHSAVQERGVRTLEKAMEEMHIKAEEAAAAGNHQRAISISSYIQN